MSKRSFARVIAFMAVLISMIGVAQNYALAAEPDTYTVSVNCGGSTQKDNKKFRALAPGTATNQFIVESPQLVRFKEGVSFEVRKDPELGIIVQPSTGGGGNTLICRCPAGFGGSCSASHGGGFPIALCSGQCIHNEVPSLTTSCGFFAPALVAPTQ